MDSLSDGWLAAHEPKILQSIRQDIGGDEQQIDQVSTRYWNVTLKHLLLPTWVGAYRFRDQPYQVIVNARTGEVQGDRPYSGAKILALIIAILLALLLAVKLFGER
jgi:hypothetical protein